MDTSYFGKLHFYCLSIATLICKCVAIVETVLVTNVYFPTLSLNRQQQSIIVGQDIYVYMKYYAQKKLYFYWRVT